MDRPVPQRVDCLDGLRGLAALWVLVGHALLLTGWNLAVLGRADLGVDLFVMLSGFLMAFHYRLREAREPWQQPATWIRFWARRYFRIAPLYYLMLAAALLLGPVLYQARLDIDAFLLRRPQWDARYLDDSLFNVLAHVTFVFGLSPDYAYRTPLPDWSLGLEMQFYAAFPLLMLLIRRLGWVAGAALIAVAGIALSGALHVGGLRFPMPAFLPLKIHVFLAGMLAAGAMGRGSVMAACHLLLAILLASIPIGGEQGMSTTVIRLCLVGLFFALVHHQHLPRRPGAVARKAANLLGNRFFHWLGELSFGTYLVHLLILQPVAAQVINRWGETISAPSRFALVLLITAPAAYLISWLTYATVEIPGQKLGRRLIQAIGRHVPRAAIGGKAGRLPGEEASLRELATANSASDRGRSDQGQTRRL